MMGASNYLRRMISIKAEDYKYITKEEYILLTGKEI
jgi:hypothetical protein